MSNQPFDRALSVLHVLSDTHTPLSVTQIAAHCSLPTPTAHRIVGQLEARELIRRVLGTKTYVVGAALVRLGRAAVEAALRTDRTHQALVALTAEIAEHCHIGIRVDNHVLYVDTVRAARSEGLYFEQGRHAPLHCTSIGKLFLADLSRRDLDAWLSSTKLISLVPRTIVVPDKLRAVVDRVRLTEWATSNQEVAVGVVGCAVPIKDPAGKLIAGLGISVPSARIAFEELTQFRAPMEMAARTIGAAIA